MISDISSQYQLHTTIGQLSTDLNRLFTIVRTIQHQTRGHTHSGEGNEGPLIGSGGLGWPLLAPAGTVLLPSYAWADGTDANTGLYRVANRNIGFAVNGAKLLDLSSALVGVTGAVTISSTLGVTGTTTAAAINLSGVLTSTNTTDATSINTGSVILDGGMGIEKALWVGGLANIAGAVTLQSTLGVTGAINSQTISSAAVFTGSMTVATSFKASTSIMAGSLTESAFAKLHIYAGDGGISGGVTNTDMIIEKNANTGLAIVADGATCSIFMGDGANQTIGRVQYSNTTDTLSFGAQAVDSVLSMNGTLITAAVPIKVPGSGSAFEMPNDTAAAGAYYGKVAVTVTGVGTKYLHLFS